MRNPSLLATLLLALALTPACRADDAKPGRVTAMAEVIWACSLENWRLSQDDGCDPIETGTAIKIHERGVKSEYPHGPFALIEYDRDGTTKLQYVIDNTVTPLGEAEPTVEELLKRERQRLSETATQAETHTSEENQAEFDAFEGIFFNKTLALKYTVEVCGSETDCTKGVGESFVGIAKEFTRLTPNLSPSIMTQIADCMRASKRATFYYHADLLNRCLLAVE